MRSHTFIVPLYNTEVSFAVGDDSEYEPWLINDLQLEDTNTLIDVTNGYAGFTFQLDSLSEESNGVIAVWIKENTCAKDKVGLNIVAHEIWHVTQQIIESCGVTDPQEASAYLYSYLLREVFPVAFPPNTKNKIQFTWSAE